MALRSGEEEAIRRLVVAEVRAVLASAEGRALLAGARRALAAGSRYIEGVPPAPAGGTGGTAPHIGDVAHELAQLQVRAALDLRQSLGHLIRLREELQAAGER